MTNNKRKAPSDLSSESKKRKNEIKDTNALILPTVKKIKEIAPKEQIKVLSKKERKNLSKIVKTKEEKLIINDLYEELKKFDELRPEEAIASLKEDVKKDQSSTKVTLVTKVKPKSKRKIKQWEKKKEANVKPVRESSPDTSDFSSDGDEVENNDIEEMDIDKIVEQVDIIEKELLIIEEPVKVEKKKEEPVKVEKKREEPMKISRKAFVTVNRPKEVQEGRLELPILGEEATIMEAIGESDVVIVSGATGCGKTTQMPQFLYEAGFTNNGYKIGVTEPRRIAAISVSERVKYELCCERGSNLVAYHVRYQNTTTCSTKVKFMTDGILLQELNNDILLRAYSAIIIDEAHERSVYTDILIGLLSVIVRARRQDYEKACKSTSTSAGSPLPPQPLKLIIMSATLRVADFAENTRLFPGEKRPPVINLEGRQFPVQVTFSKHTRPNYLEEAFKMIYKVHNESIEGGILVFVTGQQDCLTLCKWLKKAFPVTQKFLTNLEKTRSAEPMSTNKVNKTLQKINEAKEESTEIVKVNLTDFSIIPIDEEAELNTEEDKEVDDSENEEESDGDDDCINFNDLISGLYTNNNCANPVYPLPLFSLLDKEKQDLVFQPPPAGQRLIVVATNVAETSITIPNIKYVIDTGMEKVKKWDKVTGMSKFQVERISKSSAEQRKGRAGRIGPGQCYRLYSSAVFEQMAEFSAPEILQRPVEDVVLLLKSYIHNSISIREFCLPTVPSQMAVDRAETFLVSIGALRRMKAGSKNLSEITDLGKSMAKVPLSPRFSRMLLLSNQHNLLPYVVLIASLLSVPDFFTGHVTDTVDQDTETDSVSHNFKRDAIKKKPDLMLGDITVLLASFCKLENVCLQSEQDGRRVAESCGIRWKAFTEVKKLRQQITDILISNVRDLDLSISVLPRPTSTQFEHLRQLVLAGSSEHVALLSPPSLTTISTLKTAAERRRAKGQYSSCSVDRAVFIHSQSVLCRERFEWVVHQELFETAPHGDDSISRPFMRNLTVIDPHWLPVFCTLSCRAESLYLDTRRYMIGEHQMPYYDETHDKVMACAKRVTYGERSLLLPEGVRIPVVREIMENEETETDLLCRWFARFLLEGLVVKEMAPWILKMRTECKPELLLSPSANSRSEIIAMVKGIKQLQYPSRKALMDKWKINPNYLLDAYLEWITPDERESVTASWPPISI